MLKRMELSGGKVVHNGESGNIHVYVSPDQAERKHLVENLKLDEHTLASALDPDELARLEFEPDHTAIIFKRPRNYSSANKFVFKVASVGLFLFTDRLVVVLSEDIPLFQGRQFARITSLQEVALKIIYSSISHFIEHLRVINAVCDALEEQINASMENKYLLSLFSLEKSLVYYLNGIASNGKLIERLKISAAKLGLTTESVEYVDDMIIENQQCHEQAATYSNILASMMDARVSIVSNNLNWLIKTLTIITIGIMLPTLVVSFFSMNVDFPGRDTDEAFWVVVVLMFVSIIVVQLVWRWKKW